MIRLTTPSDIFPEMVEKCREHGCIVQLFSTHGVVTLPEGSRRSMVVPRTYHARYGIVLPDGYYLREILDRDGRSSLFYLEE